MFKKVKKVIKLFYKIKQLMFIETLICKTIMDLDKLLFVFSTKELLRP